MYLMVCVYSTLMGGACASSLISYLDFSLRQPYMYVSRSYRKFAVSLGE